MRRRIRFTRWYRGCCLARRLPGLMPRTRWPWRSLMPTMWQAPAGFRVNRSLHGRDQVADATTIKPHSKSRPTFVLAGGNLARVAIYLIGRRATAGRLSHPCWGRIKARTKNPAGLVQRGFCLLAMSVQSGFFATLTKAGRRRRSLMVYPACISMRTVPGSASSEGTSIIA